MDTSYIAIISGSILIGLFVLERFVPLRKLGRALWPRLMVNVIVSGLALAVGALLVQPLSSSVLGTDERHVGLLGIVTWPTLCEGLIGFLLMDLTFYYWHLLNHRIPWLWRFHNVHHIDLDLDVSTAFRFHYGEMAFSAGFRVLQIVLIGVSPATYLVYEAAFQANTLFHHSNVRMPIRLERWLNRMLVTPRMHGIHHSQVEQETNSNFSVVLPWWDWLHRTLRLNVPQADIVIGVPAYSSPEDNGLWSVLVMPFRRQRKYWLSQDEQTVQRAESDLPDNRNTLAE